MKKSIIQITLLVLFIAVHMFISNTALEMIPSSILIRSSIPVNTVGTAPFDRQTVYSSVGELTAVYTNSEYGEYAGVKMKYGRFLSGKQDEIVISDDLAAKLFLTDNIIGAKVRINQRDYTVGGVYYKNDTLLINLSSGIYDEVYLPFEENEIYASAFYVGVSDGESSEDKMTQIEHELGIRIDRSRIKDYREVRDLMLQGQKSILFICSLFAFMKSLRYFVRYLKNNDLRVRSNILKAAVLLILVIAGVIALKLCSFELILPQKYLLSGRDPIEFILGSVQEANTYSNDMLFRLSHNLLTYSFVCRTALFIAVFSF